MKHSDRTTYRTTAILFVWFLIALLVPNVWLSFTEHFGATAAVTNIVLPAGVFWLLLSATRHTGTAVLWMFPFMFLAAFQLVLLNLFGRSVIAVDMYLNVVTTNVGEATELLSDLIPALAEVVVLYVLPLVAAIIAVTKKWVVGRRFISLQRRLSGATFAAGVILLGICYLPGVSEPAYRISRDLFPVNAVSNAITAADRVGRLRHYHDTSRNYTFRATSAHPDSVADVCVVVIGETSRGENWQLAGYPRPTNPRLSNESGAVYFPNALSESNTTHKSVPLLLSSLSAATFNDSIDHVKSITTAFAEAGYETWFLSAQQHNRSYIDFFSSEADHCIYLSDQDTTAVAPGHDLRLIGLLQQALKSPSPKKFIVLHTYGSHFCYADRYGDEHRRFTPDRPCEANPAQRATLVNAYDNTILLTDELLGRVIDELRDSASPATLTYTSDHGEDIYDDSRKLFLHASPLPSYHQINVPFLVWTSPEYDALYPETVAALRANRTKDVSSSRSLFHTVLDLGGVNAAVHDKSASLASPSYTMVERRYLTDLNEAVPLDSHIVDDIDLEQIK